MHRLIFSFEYLYNIVPKISETYRLALFILTTNIKKNKLYLRKYHPMVDYCIVGCRIDNEYIKDIKLKKTYRKTI